MNCTPPGSSVHGTLQARVLEWVAIPFSRGSSQTRDWTLISSITGQFFTVRQQGSPGRLKVVTNIRLYSPGGITPHFLESQGRGLECQVFEDFQHPGYALGMKVQTWWLQLKKKKKLIITDHKKVHFGLMILSTFRTLPQPFFLLHDQYSRDTLHVWPSRNMLYFFTSASSAQIVHPLPPCSSLFKVLCNSY